MGTSSARRPPGTRAWRLAKGLAGRYFASDPPQPAAAREVVCAYLHALKETCAPAGDNVLAAFRITPTVALKVGELGEAVLEQGVPAALESLGVPAGPDLDPLASVLALGHLWVGEEGGLEAAAVRSALAACLLPFLRDRSGATIPGSALLVQEFLAQVLLRRLGSDLGESMEAASADWEIFRQGMETLATALRALMGALASPKPPAGRWTGPRGWLYVRELLEKLWHGSLSPRDHP